MSTVFSLDNRRNRDKKIFFDGEISTCNFADLKYPVFQTLYFDQLSFYWLPHEISMARDAADVRTLSPAERFVFENNLSFQTVGDSLLGKGIGGILKHVSNNELYQSLNVHSFFESSIHTPSYSHIIQNIHTDPTERFYEVTSNEKIMDRAKKSIERFDDLLNNTSKDPKLEIINTFVGLLALESISFYNSFLTSFYFAKNGKMTGTGSIIKLIARDESLHCSNGINVLKILMREECEGFTHLKSEIENRIFGSFEEMANQEFEWIDYLMSEGEPPGLSKAGLKRYVKHLTNRSIKNLGFKKDKFIFEETANPFPWVNSFLGSSKSTQVAPQEQEIVNYVKSSKNDLEDMSFD